MKQLIITKQLLNQFNLIKYKSFRQSFVISIKQGLIAFIALLLLLGLLEFTQGIFQGKQTLIINKIDFAISVFGFLLVFVGKFLGGLYGKQ